MAISNWDFATHLLEKIHRPGLAPRTPIVTNSVTRPYNTLVTVHRRNANPPTHRLRRARRVRQVLTSINSSSHVTTTPRPAHMCLGRRQKNCRGACGVAHVVVKQRPRRRAGWPAHICPIQPCAPCVSADQRDPQFSYASSARLRREMLVAAWVMSSCVRFFAATNSRDCECLLGGQKIVRNAGHM